MDQELCEFMNFGVRSSSVPEHIHVSGKLGHVLPRHNLPCVGGTVTQFAFRSGTKPSREAPAQFASLPKDDSGITDAHGGSYHLIECCPQGGEGRGDLQKPVANRPRIQGQACKPEDARYRRAPLLITFNLGVRNVSCRKHCF